MPPYSLIIFDFGGTLADSYTWFTVTMNKAAKKFDFREVSPGEIEMLRRFDYKQLLHYLGISKWKIPLITLYFVIRALGAETSAIISYFGCGLSPFGKASRFRTILRQSGVAPQRAIGIGDEIRDLQAAHATNMAAGAVAWGYADFSTLLSYSPTRSFISVTDMRDMLLG